MTILKCKICGGDLEVRAGMTVGTCGSCGSLVTLPLLDDDKRTNLYNRASQLRRAHEYDRAAALYENILAEDASDAEAYWSLVLCRFGVEYVEDPHSHKMVPTCNRTQTTPIRADEDYRQAVEHAEGEARFLYEEEARKIDAIQQGILAISSRETTPFDIFICYKETDDRGHRTEDSILAQDIYDELTSKGYRVFFSRVTLADKLGAAYEPYIFAALNSASVMLVVGTRPGHFDAVWVKNEWSRYLSLIKTGSRKTLIPVYRDISPADMPNALSRLQGQDMGQLGSMQDLIRSVQRIIGTAGSRQAILVEAESELRLNESGSEVLGFAGEPGDTLIIPAGVTSVAAGAFAGCVSLETVVFQDGMTAITSWAFSGCSGLKNIVLPDDLEIIEDDAFAGCSALECLYLGESVRIVGAGAFSGCSALKDISFSYEGLKNIGGRAFAGCCPKEIDLPRSLEAIGEQAFADCASLEEITLPVTLRSVGEGAFAGCSSLKRVTLTGGSGLDGKIPPFSNWGGGEFSAARPEIIIADYVKSIGEGAFAGCDYLVHITIPDSVRSIGKSAFAGCTSLQYTKIGDGEMKSIGAGAFAGCTALKDITLPSGLTFIGRDAFAGCTVFRSLIFPVALKTVEEGAFKGCSSLENITVKTSSPMNYTAMGLNDEGLSLTVNVEGHTEGKAFAGFTAMKSVVLHKKIEKISECAFQDCTGLTELKLPRGLKSVGAFAFAGCTGLTGEVKFPPEARDIGESAFAGCTGLERVTVQSSYDCTIEKNSFAGCIGLQYINFSSDSRVDIEEGAFQGCSGLKELSIPQASVIGRRAFADCAGLTRVTITGQYTSLGDGAFENCGQLTEVTFADCGEYYRQFDLANIFAGTPYLAISLSGVCPKCGTRIRRGKCKSCGITFPSYSGRHQNNKKRFKTMLFAFATTLIYMIAFHFFVRWLK